MSEFDEPPKSCTLSSHSQIWMIAAVAVVILLTLPNLRYPIGRDQATYCLNAASLLKGKVLYRDLWDNKPPGIFFFYIPVVKIFGRALWSVGAVDILCTLVVSLCTFLFCRRYVNGPAAALAAAGYAYLHNRPGYINAAQPEVFIVILLFVSLFLLDERKPHPWFRYFGAGVSLALAFCVKYNAIVFIPLVVFLPCLGTRRLEAGAPRLGLKIPSRLWVKRTAVLLCGFAAAVAAVLVYFWLSNAWPALKEVQFEVLPRYGLMVVERTPHYFLWALGQTAYNLHPWTEAGIPLGLLIAWRCWEWRRVAPIFLALAAGYLATATQARFNAYSFETCFPFLAMVWAYSASKTFEGFQKISQTFAGRQLDYGALGGMDCLSQPRLFSPPRARPEAGRALSRPHAMVPQSGEVI